MSIAQVGSKNHMWGKKASEETRLKMSKSHKGLNTWIKGRKLSEEHKAKISAGNLGKKVSRYTIEKMKIAAKNRNPAQWLLGKKKKPHTEEVKKKISENRKGKAVGKMNFRWIEDRTLLKDDHRDRGGQLHREWSRSVKNRDKWSCRIADKNCGEKIVAHHILSWKDYPELRYEVNNGITLCHAHHPRKRNDELKLSPYFQELIKEQ